MEKKKYVKPDFKKYEVNLQDIVASSYINKYDSTKGGIHSSDRVFSKKHQFFNNDIWHKNS